MSALKNITLQIPLVVPSPNLWVRAHWRRYQSIKTQWCEEIAFAVLGLGAQRNALVLPFEWAHVEVISYRKRLLDPDNLAGGLKPIMDGLRYAGVIQDDTARNVHITVMQFISKPPSTVIRVYPG